MSKFDGHIHSIFPGTGGQGTGTNSLRLGKFDFGVGYTGYGRTSDTNYWAIIEPVYNGNSGPGVPGLSGQTGGFVVYQYKAANGPSIVTFAPGATLSFVQYTAVIGATPGMSTLQQAINWYNGNTGATVVSNTFKSLPEIGDLVYAFDVDQFMCVRPNNTNFFLPNTTSCRELSQEQRTWGNNGAAPLPNYEGIAGIHLNLPWRLNFNTGSDRSILLTTIGSAFISGASDTAISLWLYIDDPLSTFTIITLVGSGGTSLLMYWESGTSRLYVDFNLGSSGSISTDAVVPGKWFNVTISISSEDEGDIAMYINGIVKDSSALGGLWTSWPNPMQNTVVGASDSFNSTGFLLNSIYVWKNNLRSLVPGSGGLDGVKFFYTGSYREFPM